MRRLVLILVILLNIQSSFAQLIELEIIQPKSYQIPQLSNSAKAKYHYDLGRFEECIEYMFKALETEKPTAFDHLILANSLNATDKMALANEFYNEYLRISGQEYGAIPDIKDRLLRKDSSEQPIISYLDTTSNAYGIYPAQSAYVSRSNAGLISGIIDCDMKMKQKAFSFSSSSIWINTGICYFNGGYRAIISRVNTSSSESKLFETELTKDGWSEPEQLKFQLKGVNYAFPYLDEKNNILYFSSDQEGGSGGYDIYLSYYSKGKYEDPINLGFKVNTAGHEISPSIDNGYLVFSSNGLPGKGGFDIYRFKTIDDFTFILLHDKKYSSAYDDYDIQSLGNKEYLVNRYEAKKGRMLHYSYPVAHSLFTYRVTDQNSLPIKQATVLIGRDNEGSFTRTNSLGMGQFTLLGNQTEQKVIIIAEGYESLSTTVKSLGINEIILKEIESVNIVKVVNTRDSTDEEVSFVAEKDSSASHEPQTPDLEVGVSLPQKGYYYIIVASARDYSSAYKSWSTWVETFEGLEIIKFSENLYRIGYKSGRTELNAISQLQSALKVKKDAWIIRPGTM